MLTLKTYSHSVMSFRLLCQLWTSVWPLLQLFCLFSLIIDLFQGGSYKLKWRCHAFLVCWLSLWSGLYLMCFIYVWFKLDQDLFRFIIKDSWVMPPRVSLLFVDNFEQVYVQCVKSAAKLYFAALVCSRFSWGQHYSVLAFNIVDSPTLVFIPIASI